MTFPWHLTQAFNRQCLRINNKCRTSCKTIFKNHCVVSSTFCTQNLIVFLKIYTVSLLFESTNRPCWKRICYFHSLIFADPENQYAPIGLNLCLFFQLKWTKFVYVYRLDSFLRQSVIKI